MLLNVHSISGALMGKEDRKTHLNRRADARRQMLSSDHSVRTGTTMFNFQNNVNVDGCFDLEVKKTKPKYNHDIYFILTIYLSFQMFFIQLVDLPLISF